MKPEKLTKEEVAKILEDFLNGTGDEWAWDDFMSFPIENEYLESIRLRCSGLDSEFPATQKGHYCNQEGLEVIKSYVSALRFGSQGEQ
ncbi:MAG TPA: hypothetical protein VN025_09835 [Candidatus Dormibacteraeota bacterium]|jgi:hypothetical protein|nr:hypothetical protein [Candidatus Dormibacteraeota bacterium]